MQLAMTKQVLKEWLPLPKNLLRASKRRAAVETFQKILTASLGASSLQVSSLGASKKRVEMCQRILMGFQMFVGA